LWDGEGGAALSWSTFLGDLVRASPSKSFQGLQGKESIEVLFAQWKTRAIPSPDAMSFGRDRIGPGCPSWAIGELSYSFCNNRSSKMNWTSGRRRLIVFEKGAGNPASYGIDLFSIVRPGHSVGV
jgi:hypothetical protein